MLHKFTSRKFLISAGAIFAAVGSALAGETSWAQAIWATVVTTLGYLGVEGARDIRLATGEKS